jgi:hypothetical protein
VVEVVLGFEELAGRPVDVRALTFDVKDVRQRVLAGVSRSPARQPDPPQQLAEAVPLERRPAACDRTRVAGAASVHPANRVHQRPAVTVDGHGARILRRAANRGDELRSTGFAVDDAACGSDDGRPPFLGILFGSAPRQERDRGFLRVAGDDLAGGRHQGNLGPRRAEVDREDELVCRIHG